ncbi:MAG: DUF2284 domain-containing protein [Chloroflexi bacterium]|nr:DUF2284 domain-containing protein [Chloroflexota bacterium]
MVEPGKAKIDHLLQLAHSLGASDTRMVSSHQIVVKEELAQMCLEPKCENYGLSYSCPPYVEGPAGFRKLIQTHPNTIVLRLVVPSSMLLSWERVDLGRILHEIVARVEKEARKIGYANSAAFAGGSCKELFCQDHLSCQQISTNDPCRHPDLSRSSLSGYGVDVFQLMKTCGWATNLNENHPQPVERQLSWIAGLIMIG